MGRLIERARKTVSRDPLVTAANKVERAKRRLEAIPDSWRNPEIYRSLYKKAQRIKAAQNKSPSLVASTRRAALSVAGFTGGNVRYWQTMQLAKEARKHYVRAKTAQAALAVAHRQFAAVK